MSLDKMIEKIAALQNPTVAGLDPKLDYIPQYLREEAYARHSRTLEGAAAAILAYNKGLIDALCGIVPAVKPQAAYYEMYGWQGVRTLYETIRYAHEKGMYVILDGKRNDIGATMESYAAAWLGLTAVENELAEPFGADSLTVNGYLGSDGINPLLKVCGEQGRGIFVLVKTSNPSSGELQDQKLENGETDLPHDGPFLRELGQVSSRQVWLFRGRRSGRRNLSGTARRAACGHALDLLPRARLRCTGRRREGRCSRF